MDTILQVSVPIVSRFWTLLQQIYALAVVKKYKNDRTPTGKIAMFNNAGAPSARSTASSKLAPGQIVIHFSLES